MTFIRIIVHTAKKELPFSGWDFFSSLATVFVIVAVFLLVLSGGIG